MENEEGRIFILESIGWKDLNRDSRMANPRALRGTSPIGKKNQIAPNPFKSLDSVKKIEDIIYLSQEHYQLYKKFLEEICENENVWVAMATAEQKSTAIIKTFQWIKKKYGNQSHHSLNPIFVDSGARSGIIAPIKLRFENTNFLFCGRLGKPSDEAKF